MDWAAIDWMNHHQCESVREQLETGVKTIIVKIPGRKHTRNKQPYYTLIGGEARKYLKAQCERVLNCYKPLIFVNQYGNAVSYQNTRRYWIRCLRTLGIDKPPDDRDEGYRTGKNFHKIRRVFRSRIHFAKTEGFDTDVAEFLMGHDIDPNKYNEFFHNTAYVKSQYRIAKKYLSLTFDATKLSKYEVSDLHEKLMDYEERLNRYDTYFDRMKERFKEFQEE